MLRPGYRADLVLLDSDLFSIPPEAIEAARVRATIAGGKVVYQETQ
jgi:predicted amidohydrolase YtcJ